MIEVKIVLLLLLIHLIADFFLQTDWMALNKSKDGYALLAHTSVYSACFLWLGWEFAWVTWALHTLTDAITSQITAKLWFIPMEQVSEIYNLWYAYPEPHKRHWFFVVIGVDQFIHYATLLLTYQALR